MKKKQRHEFESMPEFDSAMRQLVAVPKESVNKAIEKDRQIYRQKKKRTAKKK